MTLFASAANEEKDDLSANNKSFVRAPASKPRQTLDVKGKKAKNEADKKQDSDYDYSLVRNVDSGQKMEPHQASAPAIHEQQNSRKIIAESSLTTLPTKHPRTNHQQAKSNTATADRTKPEASAPPKNAPPKPPLPNVPTVNDGKTPSGPPPADAPSTRPANAPIYYPESAVTGKSWDVFRVLPPPPDSLRQSFWVDASLQLLKVVTYVVVACLLLGSAVVAKGSFLLMTSAIGWQGHNITICKNPATIGSYANNTVVIEAKHVVKWVWSIYIALCLPEIFCFIRCFHRVLFRNVKKPTVSQFFLVFIIETLNALGVGLLVFKVLPGLDALTGAMLTSCFCFVPAVFSLMSRKPGRLTIVLVFLDIVSIGAQSSGFWAWPVFIPQLATDAWAVPVAICLISLAWWQNFAHSQSVFPFIRKLAKIATALNEKRSKTYIVVSLWKCLVYFCALFAFMSMRMNVNELLEDDPFGAKPIRVIVRRPNNMDYSATESQPTTTTPLFTEDNYISTTFDPNAPIVVNAQAQDFGVRGKRQLWVPRADHIEKLFSTRPNDALWVLLIQAIAVYCCYQCAKFASKVMMQRLCLAAPLTATVPLLIFILGISCSKRAGDPCYMTETLPFELFWRCYSTTTSVSQFFSSPQTWVWLVWFLSQVWITIHLWYPKCEKLASTDSLFVLPWFSAAFIDQSLALNRRKDDKAKIRTEDIELDGEDAGCSGLYETISTVATGNTKTPSISPPSLCSESSSKLGTLSRDTASPADGLTKIYACATMWHESPLEMMCMLKSIFRLDEDQSARRNAQKYLKIIDPDYYEYEAHIFFDDAFETNEYGEPIMNKFVRQLVGKVDEAASAVHQTVMRLKPPKKYSTPYGGRLSWILPGKNRLTVHMKDKTMIRHRKRWSQVMYLYYLLGFRVMQKVEDQQRKELISENTFILTLDGDVDFKPSCVHLLVDLMKKNRRLGAACGRIHPRGTGLMMWYQKFEYAIGHWFQKATEHMVGCVLCSPGCFSLFRSCALMDDNVAKRYATKSENPKDYIQYDQGEDRWLCTLLLQRGYRVEYCAASDALTFAPEGFNEFFNQRRRWIPSTVANIIDLLVDYRSVVRVNESISIWYIGYQFVMLLSSILGPGTIFLMVVGAISISFNLDTALSFLVVMIPVIMFGVVCLTCKSDKQLLVAQVISALFAMLMTAVIVGTALQIKKDGIYSPHAIFLFAIIVSFFIAACLHPLEFTCIIPGILYFMAIPCMYMLLPIYSVCNLHIVTWGTRENPRYDEEEDKGSKGRSFNIFDNGSTAEPAELDGVYSMGCGNVCKFMCCLQPSMIGNSPHMTKLQMKLEEIDKKLDRMDRRGLIGAQRRGSLGLSEQLRWGDSNPLLPEEDEVLDDHFDMAPGCEDPERHRHLNESWLNERCLRRAERDYLDNEEEGFWRDAIDKYLFPLKVDKNERERIRAGLLELRNKVTFGFFMVNALFILIVFLLQLKKDCLHVEWPLGPKINQSIIPCNSDIREEVWIVTRLQLEPIGLVFLIFFVSILVLQFFAMLMHRFGTLSHILASTDLFCFRKTLDKLSEDELVVQNAVEIARELQAIRGVDESEEAASVDDQTISRRRVVHNLESSRRSMMKRRTETLDAAFKKRFFALSSEVKKNETPILGSRNRLTMRKGTIRALEHRRQTVFGTLDHGNADAHAYSDSAAADDTVAPRGPARRRLDRIFHHKTGEERQEGEEHHSSSDEDTNLKPADYQPPSYNQLAGDFSSVTGTHRQPIRKLINQANRPPPDHQQNGLLDSPASSEDRLQAHF